MCFLSSECYGLLFVFLILFLVHLWLIYLQKLHERKHAFIHGKRKSVCLRKNILQSAVLSHRHLETPGHGRVKHKCKHTNQCKWAMLIKVVKIFNSFTSILFSSLQISPLALQQFLQSTILWMCTYTSEYIHSTNQIYHQYEHKHQSNALSMWIHDTNQIHQQYKYTKPSKCSQTHHTRSHTWEEKKKERKRKENEGKKGDTWKMGNS